MSSQYASSSGQGGRGRGSGRGGGRGDFGGGRGGYGGGGRGGYNQPQVYVPSGVDDGLNKQVTTVEDSVISGIRKMPDIGNLTLDPENPTPAHAKRPGYGTKGAEVKLWANYFQIIPPKGCTLYKYTTTVTPKAEGKRLGRIMELALATAPLADFRGDVVTDFRTLIISQKKLQPEDTILHITYRSEGQDEPMQGAPEFQVQVKFTNTLPVSELVDGLSSANQIRLLAGYQEIIQAFNIFLNHYARSKDGLAQVGANKTFSIDQQNALVRNLGSGLTAARGFFSSVRVATARMLVNVNVSYGAFYQESRLDELMREIAGPNYADKASLARFMTKMAVKTTHLPVKKNRAGQVIDRVRRKFSLATTQDGRELKHPAKVPRLGAGSNEVQFWYEPSAHSTPETASSSEPSGGKGKGKGKSKAKATVASSSSVAGRYITVEEYFKLSYKKQLINPRAPVINVGDRANPVYLPPEVCIVLPGQTASTKLSAQQTSEMIRFAVRRPFENAQAIVDHGVHTVGLRAESNAKLAGFGIRTSNQLITVQGRVLNVPKIRYGKTELNPNSGSWNLRDVGFLRPKALQNQRWTCLPISVGALKNPYDGPAAFALMRTLSEEFARTGMTVAAPLKPTAVHLGDVDDPFLANIMAQAASRVELIVFLLPSTDTALYNRIKTLGDVRIGVHTICLVAPKLPPKSPPQLSQYLANIALKANLKLGGTNHTLDPSRLRLLAEGKTMLVGIDVTHPSPSSHSSAPSIAGVVASIDPTLSQFPAALRVQEARREAVAELGDMFASRLRLWARHNSDAFPENVVVYRDGVSEGQYDHVLGGELTQLREAARRLYPASDTARGLPRFTLIVVGKRHHTRFYPTAAAHADRGSNCVPGTVVDRGVTMAASWDFFLQPHAAIQGTARPGHYYVLVDEVFAARYRGAPTPQTPWLGGAQNLADVVEEFTHSLCYMFGRATKAVSLCPPAYYADIVCERARAYLGRVFDLEGVADVESAAAGSAAGKAGEEALQREVEVHENLRDSMFYI